MSVSLTPYPRFKAFVPGAGGPLAGGKLYTLQPGTVGFGFPKATYTDSTASVQNTNPVILDASGEADVWFAGFAKLALYDSGGVLVWSRDNVSSAAALPAGAGQWISQALALTYVSATQLAVPGDQTALFQPGLRVQASVTAGTICGTVTASSKSGSPAVTTVTINWDSGGLDSGLSAIATGVITPQQSALPGPPTYVSNYASLTAAVAALGARPASLFINTPTTITAATTVPATVSLEVAEGCPITQTGAYTLAINGAFRADGQAFSNFSPGQVTGLKEVRPELWGAKGDAVFAGGVWTGTDDYAALACWAAAAGGAKGIWPARTYLTGTVPIAFPANSHIKADDRFLSKIVTSAVHVSGIVTLATSSTLDGGTLDGHGLAGKTIYATGNDVTIRDIRVIDSGSNAYGIHFYGGNNPRIEDNYLEALTGTPNHQVFVSAAVNVRITGNHVNMLQQLGGSAAIRVDNSTEVRIEGNYAAGGNVSAIPTAISGDPQQPNGAGGLCHDVVFTGNTVFNSSGDGISSGGTPTGGYATNHTMTGNTVDGSTDYGMSMTVVANGVISGNTVRNASTTGIGLVDCYNIAITGNSCLNNGQANFITDGGVGSGINVLTSSVNSCHNITITGNTCTDLQGTKTQKYGIYFDGTAHPQLYVTLADNNMDGNKLGVISFNGGVLPTGFAAHDNGSWLVGSTAWDPGTVANGAGAQSAGMPVAGAAFGDTVLVYPPYNTGGLMVAGRVYAAGYVQISVFNGTGADITLGSGTWLVKVLKQS